MSTRSLAANTTMLENIERRHNTISFDSAYEAFLGRHSTIAGIVKRMTAHGRLNRFDAEVVERNRNNEIMFERIELSLLWKNHESIDLFVWLWKKGKDPLEYIARRYDLKIDADISDILETYIFEEVVPVQNGPQYSNINNTTLISVPRRGYRIKTDKETRDKCDAIVGTLLDKSPVLKQPQAQTGAAIMA